MILLKTLAHRMFRHKTLGTFVANEILARILLINLAHGEKNGNFNAN